MAAQVVAWRNYIQNTLKFTPEEAHEIVLEQGFNSPAMFARATKDDINSLVKKINKTVVDPTNNPDVTFTINQAETLKLEDLCDYSRLIYMIDREHDVSLGTIPNLRRISRYFRRLRNSSNDYEDISEVMPTKFDDKNTVDMIESVEHWLKRNRGKGGTPLIYIVREFPDPDLNPTPDPGFLIPSVEDEAIRRSMHREDEYAANNKAVWNMIRSVCHGTEAWPVIKSHQRSEDGRQAYLDLIDHYQGEGHRDKRRAAANRILSTTTYNGKRNFPFEKFSARVLGAFEDLRHCGDPMSENMKVTKFLSMIVDGSQGAGLDACKTVVRNNPECMASLRVTINTMQTEDTAQQTTRLTSIRGARALAEVDRGGRNGGRNGRNNGRNRGGHGRGRGDGRGRNGGGGRGRGGRAGRGGAIYSEDGRHILNNGGYPADVWNSFTDNDRRVVLQARERADSRIMSQRDISELQSYRDQERERRANQGAGSTPSPAPGATGAGARRGPGSGSSRGPAN